MYLGHLINKCYQITITNLFTSSLISISKGFISQQCVWEGKSECV